MRLAGGATMGFGLVVLGAGLAGWMWENWLSLILGLLPGALLVWLGVLSWRGTKPAAYTAVAAVFLASIFFAYRFLSTGDLLPSGLLLVLGFMALFLVLLGFFLALAQGTTGPGQAD